MKQGVFLECAMAVDASSDSAVDGRAAGGRRRSANSDAGPTDDVLLLDTPQDTPVGTPCSDFLAIGKPELSLWPGYRASRGQGLMDARNTCHEIGPRAPTTT